MNNITIGPTDANWRVAATARYYAERDLGKEFGFGMTPAQALERLEERETLTNQKFDQNLADEIAFLALGAAEFLRDNRDVNLDKFNGYMGLISEVIRYAPLLSRRWRQMEIGEFDGVWLYDVTERFGREWAEELLSGSNEIPSERLEYIISDEMEKWL